MQTTVQATHILLELCVLLMDTTSTLRPALYCARLERQQSSAPLPAIETQNEQCTRENRTAHYSPALAGLNVLFRAQNHDR